MALADILPLMDQALKDRFAQLGVHVPRLIIPSRDVDLYRWAVIACDQHTSEPDYWEEVEHVVGDSPSTLRIVFPEVYLEDADADSRLESVQARMREYLDSGVVRQLDPGMVMTVRSTPHVSARHGLMLAIDLEKYDFTEGSKSIVRPTERTIVERLPARVKIRAGAPMEVPHVLVLIDDPEDTVLGALADTDPDVIYNTQLMLGGGSVTGYHVPGAYLEPVAAALEALLAGARGRNPFLFAVGDGNHSLAAAKQVWESIRGTVSPEHPARFALVEVVNLYDPGLRFEPIHRLVSTEDPAAWFDRFASSIGTSLSECGTDELRRVLGSGRRSIGFVSGDRAGVVELANGRELPVDLAQDYLNSQEGIRVDYIHGWDTSVQLGGKRGNVALLLPEFDPGMLFPTVAKRGVLPRKAFSLGEAEEKRYYLEARLIVE
jgi:hypothetical protein